ncbi:MAG: hypothetical protein WB586_16940 [Chthoniobacterales bacterium]
MHEGRITKGVEELEGGTLAYIETLIQYGPVYLSETELAGRRKELLADLLPAPRRLHAEDEAPELLGIPKGGVEPDWLFLGSATGVH